MPNTLAVPRCGRRACDYFLNGDASCTVGGGTCSAASLLEAEPSIFHDDKLIDATRRIKEILESIPPDPAGRTISFLRTPFGTLLAWVNHGEGAIPEGAVTANDDDATIARALRLKGYAATSASQS